MNCTNCGSQVVAGAKFCENCGMATAIAQPVSAPAQPAPAAAPAEKSAAVKQRTPKKMIPKGFVITSLILSVLAGLGIVGYFLKPFIDLFQPLAESLGIGAPLAYAGLFLAAIVGPITLFYLFMLIFFLAKHYGHGSKLIPIFHLVLYILGAGGIGGASAFLYQSQIALFLLILASAVSFVMICLCLYFLLREQHEE